MAVRDLGPASGLDMVIRSLQARGTNTIERILAAAREHLGMDLAFISEFTDDEQVILQAIGDSSTVPVKDGDRYPLASTYCQRAVSGLIPFVIHDSLSEPGLCDLPSAVRSYVGVPVRFSDGRLFGTLCCVSGAPDPSLGERDLKILQVLGRLIAERLEEDRAEDARRLTVARKVRALLSNREIKTVFQPVMDLRSGRVVGVEALARFGDPAVTAPDVLLAEASSMGLGLDLERAAALTALKEMGRLDEVCFMSVNLSPSAIQSPWFPELVAQVPPERLVVEVTEHARVEDYDELTSALSGFRRSGGRLAIDDAGAGFASLRHILRLSPSIIKLDATLTRNINADPVRRALASALAGFAHNLGAAIVAEGIETAAEKDALMGLGIQFGQGRYLAAPSALDAHGLRGARA